MNAVVFVGPSLSHAECRQILDAEYYPPVKRGDLTQLSESVDTVVIIDGVMLNSAAVGHREILSLLNLGITVIGGGSMGALRAAELSSFGMIGIGKIFSEYDSGKIIGDDEVVLSYDPFSLAPLSEPLVNFRLNLEKAVENNAILMDVADTAISEMKKTFYPKRNQVRFKEIMKTLLSEDEFREFFSYWKSNYCDFKRSDAEQLLYYLQASAKNLHI